MIARLKRLTQQMAWASLLASFPVWGAAFVVAPFLDLPAEQRGALAGGLLVAGELMFWGAGLVLGKQVLARFRKPRVNTGRSLSGKSIAVDATGGLESAIARAARRGIDVRKPLAAHSGADIRNELNVDLLGSIFLVHALLGNLSEGGSMAILGGFGDVGLAFPYYSVDVAARAGLAVFCKSVNRELELAGRTERLSYVSPAPADTEAERPYAKLWADMGARLVYPAEVADFVLATLLTRKATAIMGWSTRLLTFVNASRQRLPTRLRCVGWAVI